MVLGAILVIGAGPLAPRASWIPAKKPYLRGANLRKQAATRATQKSETLIATSKPKPVAK